jgi:hypothetical protein
MNQRADERCETNDRAALMCCLVRSVHQTAQIARFPVSRGLVVGWVVR